MKLTIDGITIDAVADKSIYEICQELGLFTGRLSTDPIAAKIAGRVFTLNYVPLRTKDIEERESVRRAVAASGGVIRLQRYRDPIGRDVYMRTSQFILFLAISRLWPKAEAKMSCTVGSGYYIKISGAKDFDVDALKSEVQGIVNEAIPLKRKRITTAQAIDFFRARGMEDKARLLEYRTAPHFNLYENGDFSDYYYGEMEVHLTEAAAASNC